MIIVFEDKVVNTNNINYFYKHGHHDSIRFYFNKEDFIALCFKTTTNVDMAFDIITESLAEGIEFCELSEFDADGVTSISRIFTGEKND